MAAQLDGLVEGSTAFEVLDGAGELVECVDLYGLDGVCDASL